MHVVQRERQHTSGIFMAGGTWHAQGAHGNEVGLRRIHYHTLSVSVLGSDSNSF